MLAEFWKAHVDLRARLDRVRFRRCVNARKIPGLQRLGDKGTTGWVVPVARIHSTWTCYTIGVGVESSFDVALAELGCQVVAIDPTPRSAAHIAPVVARYNNMRFLPRAVWHTDAEVRLYEPATPGYVSHSVNDLHCGNRYIMATAQTLASIAQELGDDRVDLIKMDIEGAELDVIPETDFRALGTNVLCVEFHNHHGVDRMVESVRSLEDQGYTPVYSRLTDVTFVRSS